MAAKKNRKKQKTYHNIVNVDITLTAAIQGKEEFFHDLNSWATNIRAQHCNHWGRQSNQFFSTGD